MTILVKQDSPGGGNVTSAKIYKISQALNYQCYKRPGLKFSGIEGCKSRRTRAEEHPAYVELSECLKCPGPIPLTDTGEHTLANQKNEVSITEESSTKNEMCKCGRGPVVIRKNGVSAGRCRECMSDTAKSWPRGKKQSKTKNNINSNDKETSFDSHVLLGLLKERKEDAEDSLNNLLEKGALNGDKEISQAIISFVKLTATLDVVLKSKFMKDNKTDD